MMKIRKFSIEKRTLLIIAAFFWGWMALALTSCTGVAPPDERDVIIESKIYRPDLIVMHDCSTYNGIEEYHYVESIEDPVISEETRLGKDKRESEKYFVACHGKNAIEDPFFKYDFWTSESRKRDPNFPTIKYVGMSSGYENPLFLPTFLDLDSCCRFRCDIYSDEILVMTFKVDYTHGSGRWLFRQVVDTYLEFALLSKKNFRIGIKPEEVENREMDVSYKVDYLKEHFLKGLERKSFCPLSAYSKMMNSSMTLEQALDLENIYEKPPLPYGVPIPSVRKPWYHFLLH